MTKDSGAPPATRKRKGRAERQRGITKPPEHPDSVEHARKCGHAVILKYLYEMSWEEVAATLWPVDENGDATAESKPMWNSGNSAFRAVKRFQQGHLIQNREEVIEKALSQVSLRQSMLAAGVSRGDLFAIQQHRAETELLLKITGGCAPAKVSLTTPDGNDAVPLVESGGLTALLAMARQGMGSGSDGRDAGDGGAEQQEDTKPTTAPKPGND